MRLRILNTRQVKKILSLIKDQYGCSIKFDYGFLMDSKNRIFLISRDVNNVELEKLRINSMGLYFGELSKGDQIRLTIEGSQLVGPHAEKNVVELNDEQVRKYFQGMEVDIDLDVQGNPFVLLKHGNDFFGTAKYKNGALLNYLPKVHRTTELIL